MMLVDSSAWIEFLRASTSPVDLRLGEAMEASEPLAIVAPVLMEVLAGARDEVHQRRLARLLGTAELVPLEQPDDFEAAGALYARCRSSGVTVRSLTDCLIAVVAMRAGLPLLHRDSDFELIARQVPLSLVEL